jgi:hypothetical protein
MTHFDPDLIAALAEGSLEPARAAELERAVAADPVAAAELAAQRAALEAVRGAAPITLSDGERTRLRSSVAEQLGVVRERSPKLAPVRRRRVHWPAIAVATASLVAIVAVVPGVLRTGDDAERAGTMVLAEESTVSPEGDARLESADAAATTMAASQPMGSDEVLGTTGETVETPGAEDGATVTTTAPTTTAAATTTAPALEPALRELLRPGVLVADQAVTACAEEGRAVVGGEAVAAQVSFDGIDAVAWFVPGPEDPAALAVFAAADCTLLASLP